MQEHRTQNEIGKNCRGEGKHAKCTRSYRYLACQTGPSDGRRMQYVLCRHVRATDTKGRKISNLRAYGVAKEPSLSGQTCSRQPGMVMGQLNQANSWRLFADLRNKAPATGLLLLARMIHGITCNRRQERVIPALWAPRQHKKRGTQIASRTTLILKEQ
jgi:hypothetical protein